jgi:hypothetical protein
MSDREARRSQEMVNAIVARFGDGYAGKKPRRSKVEAWVERLLEAVRRSGYEVVPDTKTHAGIESVLGGWGAVDMWLCGSVMAPRCKEGEPPVFGPEGHGQCGRYFVVPYPLREVSS